MISTSGASRPTMPEDARMKNEPRGRARSATWFGCGLVRSRRAPPGSLAASPDRAASRCSSTVRSISRSFAAVMSAAGRLGRRMSRRATRRAERSRLRGRGRSDRPVDHARRRNARSTGRAGTGGVSCLFRLVRYLEARLRSGNWRRSAGRLGYRGRRRDGGRLRRTCLIRSRMVQSLLNMALRKAPTAKTQIAQVTPAAAIAGGEFQIRGKGFARGGPAPRHHRRCGGADRHRLGFLRDRARAGRRLRRRTGRRERRAGEPGLDLRHRDPIADSLHPVANPGGRFASATSTPPSADRAARKCRSRSTRSI